MLRYIIKKIGLTGIVIIIIIIAIYTYGILKKVSLNNDPIYTKGISLGLDKGVRGNIIFNYYYYANNEKFNGFVTGSFCEKCNTTCKKGDTVIVKFQRKNPANSELVCRIPVNK